MNIMLKTSVRTILKLNSREQALRHAEAYRSRYASLAAGLSPEQGQRSVEVPPMPGVDDDMRRWSFYMILEHNTIVNRSMTAMVVHLAQGTPIRDGLVKDPKKDVMPSVSAGAEQLAAFNASVEDHISTIPGIGALRGTRRSDHVVFGSFDAHMWNSMFSFHLGLHLRQAAFVAKAVHR